MFRTAEIELYPLTMSNGVWDENQNWMKTKNENKSGRFGRYRNRIEARKNVPRSWDRGLSSGNVKRVAGDRKIIKMVNMFLSSGTDLSTCYCWRSIFWCFSVLWGSKSQNFVVKNKFSFQIWSKIVASIVMNFHFSISCFRFCYIFAKFHIFHKITKFASKV